jgi:hypothetical protein
MMMAALLLTKISGVLFGHNNAEAIQDTVVGSGSAAPVLIDSGNFACTSNPGPAGSASYELGFAATSNSSDKANNNNGTVSGVWYISIYEETAGHILQGEQHGTLSNGTISSKGYNLTGEITFDNLCSTNPLPTPMNITGQCGFLASRDPNVELRAASNETGAFLATVFCSP